MSGQIIEIQSDNRHLSCERGFMTVSSEGQVVAKIPMSDVEAVITASHGISYSNNLLVRLAEENIPFVFCNKISSGRFFMVCCRAVSSGGSDGCADCRS